MPDLAVIRSTGEILFLATGVYMTWCIRNARIEIYREKWYLCSVIYIETMISSITYVLRHIFYSKIHPDYTYLMYFIRCQLTVTLGLALILGPKVSLGCRLVSDLLIVTIFYSVMAAFAAIERIRPTGRQEDRDRRTGYSGWLSGARRDETSCCHFIEWRGRHRWHQSPGHGTRGDPGWIEESLHPASDLT